MERVVVMQLKALLEGVGYAGPAPEDVEIKGLSYDTRTLRPGELFVALRGYKTDGHRYIGEALQKGAAAVVCEEMGEGLLTVPDSRAALAVLSANWFGHPARALTVVGVTGTNGKTTTTSLLKAMIEEALGTKAGLIGTNENRVGDEVYPADRTTPESWEVQHWLRRMADSGCTHVVMEVSSHALCLHRVDGIHFAVGAFTNLTQDHLDFHKTMEAYKEAKGRLFKQCGTAVLNLDDEAGRSYAAEAPCPVFTYSERRDEADLTAKNLRLFSNRVEFEAVTREEISRVKLGIPGGFTVYNALCALGCAHVLGISISRAAIALAKAPGVKGRMEVVPTPGAGTVLIDYAHTPDALENALITLRDFTQGRLICLFGCGGDRDRGKRPIMGALAASLADFVVVTSDNPRTEEPTAIIDDILKGMKGFETPRLVEPDRRKAIRAAVNLLEEGDTLVLAGKGHETYQEVNGEKHHLDEREEVAACFT
ncbi:MAG: UDP-N-acetylmuramoyl-L-alanyl-D-glutamate--2,6-diaminopimelate ligase [Pseudoflavonifractor sp.]|nr:UDP-N-acetylmuramoyl-L-alanyl-D-glutamate--2,6-diaminopimelate ligase [Pseudoflavonifractor sp.]